MAHRISEITIQDAQISAWILREKKKQNFNNQTIQKKFLYLLFWKVLSNLIFINILSALKLLPFDPLDALTLDISSTDQHALESSKAKIVVTLR